MGYLPRTDSLNTDEKIHIAREEGYDPRAIERSRHLRQHLAHMANFPAQDTA